MIKYCSLEVVPEIFCLIMLSNQKNNQIKLTEHGLFKPSKFSSLLNFHSLILSSLISFAGSHDTYT